MDPEHARALLGVGADLDVAALRAAYRRQVAAVHPDVNPAPDAAERTIELRTALAVLVEERLAPPDPAEPAGPHPRPAPVAVRRVDRDTIGLALPPDETLLTVLDAVHALGQVAYLDPAAGLVEVVVEFVEAPTSSVLLHLQGRGTGETEVVCTVEPLSGGEVPPVEAVTDLVRRTLVERLEGGDQRPTRRRHVDP